MSKRIFILTLILITGCIDPVNIKVNALTNHLVVESNLTNLPGQQYVRLSVSKSFKESYYQFVENASVYVTGDYGEYFPFYYQKAGYYYPDATSLGTIGHIYTLHIVTGEGKEYESQPVMMSTPVPIDSVYFKYGEQLWADVGDRNAVLTPGYYALVNYKDPSASGNFYRWTYTCQYVIKTDPENYIDRSHGFPVHAPKQCCSYCWINESGENIIVNDDRLTNGKEVVGQQALFIPFIRYLHYKYELTLFQHTIPEEEYIFFKTLENVGGNTGAILDPPPSEFKGNIFNVNDKSEKVIGIFDASGTSIYQVTLNGNDIPYAKETFIYDDDCRTIPNSTVTQPPDFR